MPLTPAGRAYWDSLQSPIYDFYRQAASGFRFDDKVALVHFLNRLNEGLGQVSLGGAPDDAAASANDAEDDSAPV